MATVAGASKLQSTLSYSITGGPGLSIITYSPNLSTVHDWSAGVGDNQCNIFHDKEYSVTAGATQNLDLAAVLTNVFGEVLTFVKVKAMKFVADALNDNLFEIGGAGANPFAGPFKDATDIIQLHPGDELVVTKKKTGWTVTAGTGDILKLVNTGAATNKIKVLIAGTNA